MITRLLAAAVGLAILLPAVIFGGTLAVEVLVPVAALICLAEYAAMAFPQDRYANGAALVVGWAALYAPPLYLGFEAAYPVVGLVTLGSLVWVTFRPGPSLEGAADRAARLLLGVLWVSFLTFLPLLRREAHGLHWIFLLLAISWLGDTGGYFAGKYLGRHKLYEKVSPKKTVEGAIGGITLATVGAFGVRAAGLSELSVVDCLVLGPLLCTVGIVGDLSESMLKRAFQVKDSGWIMPGHGGLLDRIDSVLFVGPVLFAWVTWMEG